MFVPEEIRKCVAFVTYISSKTGKETPAGTAFLVAEFVPNVTDSSGYGYWVTAKHVIIKCREEGRPQDNLVRLRVNTKDGRVGEIDTKADDWVSHPSDSSVDVAVLDAQVDHSEFDISVVSTDMASTVAASALHHAQPFGLGDEVFFPGLFAPYSIQSDRNIPIIRSGTIAAMPEGRSIRTSRFGLIEGYLIESRSMGGLSGSPVFVQTESARLGKKVISPITAWWLGLVHGHWDHDVDSLVASTDVSRAAIQKLNMGIAIVVPVEKVLEVLNQDDLRKRREQAFRDAGWLPSEDHTGRLS